MTQTFVDVLRSTVPGGRVVVLADASTPVERQVIDEAVEVAGLDRDVQVVSAQSEDLGDLLDDSEVLVVPVRVAWLPSERDGDRRADWPDLVRVENPRRPRPSTQRRIAKSDPDRLRVVVGAPAAIKELRDRWVDDTGGQGGGPAFAGYVRRRAVVAMEREERAQIGDRYKVPRLVADEILASTRWRDQVDQLAGELGRSTGEVAESAEACLHEMVASQSQLAIDAFRAFTAPMHRRAWRVDVDATGFEALRELNRRTALVFLPSHRSYADPLILAGVLDEHGFPPNHTMGGANVSFWPLGPLARRSGVVFIRRTMKGDEPYKLALREYLGYLVAKRFNLEWYMEGGRSRTGKLRAPRFGLLQFLVDAIEAGRADDVSLVPVSITYDQLHEIGAMASEEFGGTKRPEDLGWLARYMRAQRRRAGTAYVRFGEPLSLRDGLAAAGESGADRRVALQKVAFEVFAHINLVTPITSMSLVTLALLGVDGRALTVGEVERELEPWLAYVARRDLPRADPDGLADRAGVRRTLATLVDARLVSRYDAGTDPVFSIEPGKHHGAAFYRNSAIHWFVNRAISELALLRVSQKPSEEPLTVAWEEALRLRDLLKFEFYFQAKRVFRDEIVADAELLAPDMERWATASPAEARRFLLDAEFLAAPVMLRPFVEALFVVADRLAAHPVRKAIDEKAFVAHCQGVGRQYLRQRRLRSPEAISGDLFANALQLVANRDLLDPGRDELAARRAAFAAEVTGVLDAIDAIDAIDAERRRIRREAVEEVTHAGG